LPSKKSGVRYGGFFSVRCETNSSTVAYTSKLDNMCPHDLITYKVLQQSSYKYIVSQTSNVDTCWYVEVFKNNINNSLVHRKISSPHDCPEGISQNKMNS
jgi:hypothetical protein